MAEGTEFKEQPNLDQSDRRLAGSAAAAAIQDLLPEDVFADRQRIKKKEMDLLPEDVLADVLRRLAPRWLASSRHVCRAWRAAVDGRGLLTAVAALLPRSLAGIFIQHNHSWAAFLLRRPSAAAVVSADLDYTLPGASDDEIYSHEAFNASGHCNGLLLLDDDRVVNPATRQWARLPPRPPPAPGHYFYSDLYLVYDPVVSPHYEVFAVPRLRRKQRGVQMMREEESPFLFDDLDPAVEELEWPPSTSVLHVFSSRTGRWEKRSFVRQGAAAGTVAGMRIDPFIGHRYGIYWRGALYVHCQTDFIMKLSLSSQEYQLIQLPVAFKPDSCSHESYARRLSIGKSEKGVYSVLVDQSEIKVWILDQSNDQFNWVSKQLIDGHLSELQDKSFSISELESHGPWVLQAISSHYYAGPNADGSEPAEPDQFEWDSDNDNLLPENGNRTGYKRFITFIGFHPFKEVIFLNDSMVRVLAYHLNSSKIQDLGYAFPEDELLELLNNQIISVEASFPYTPCWMRDFPQNDSFTNHKYVYRDQKCNVFQWRK